MKDRLHRHSWWVWVLIAATGWALLAYAAPKVHDVPARPAISAPR
jgi:hypothetical protein